MELAKPKTTPPAPGNRRPGGARAKASDALSVANLVTPFILGGGIGIIRTNPPKIWRRLSPYTKAMVLASAGEAARRRGLRETAGACFALGAEMAAEHAARQAKASKAAKSADAPAGDGQAQHGLPLPIGGGDDVDAVIRQTAQAMGELPLSIGSGVARAASSFIDDIMPAAA